MVGLDTEALFCYLETGDPTKMLKKKTSAKGTTEKIINALLSGKMGRKYQRKYVAVVGGEVLIVPKKDQKKFLTDLRRKFPKQTPHFVFVPGPEAYIL